MCQRIPLSVLARNPHKGLVREISHQIGEKTREGKVPELSTEERSQQKRAVNRSRGKATVRERRMLSEELGPVDPETAHRKPHKSVKNLTLLALGANPSP